MTFALISHRHRGLSLILAAAAGGILTLSYAPFFLWPLGFISIIFLYGLVCEATSIQGAAILGGAFGLSTFGVGASWVYIALPKELGIYVIPANISTIIFITYLAFFTAGACALTHWLCKTRTSSWLGSAIFASIWVLGEWLRGNLFGGFTSQSIGYLQIDGPLAGFAPAIGTYGLSWISVFICGLFVHIFSRPKDRMSYLLCVGIICLTAWAFSFVAWTQPFGQPASVRLLQPNMNPGIKFSPEKIPVALEQYYALITAKPADLIVTPETALPMYWNDLPPNYIEGLSRFAQASKSNVLLGIASVQNGEQATNNVVGILADAHTTFPQYKKFHLMPFGEYMPVGFDWFANPGDLSQGRLTSGDWSQPVMPAAGQRLGFIICQEGMFGEEVIRWIPDATIFINPGNFAWFINSFASAQMLQIVRMRAAETGRPILSAPNTGITAIIDHHGNVTVSLPPAITGVLEGTVQGMQGRTPYSRWGNYPVFALMLLTALCALASTRQSNARRAVTTM